MNAYLNYLLEASIGLTLFLLVYQLLLRKETSFRFNRIFLLIAIVASVTFPLFDLNTEDSPVPSLNFSVDTATYETSSLSIDESVPETVQPLSTWEILAILYAIGLGVFLIVFIIRLSGMLKALKRSSKYDFNNHHIVELKSQDSPFSFFNYIFIGNTPPLSEKEKQQIIAHESIHARLYHSVDIVLLNILGIIFWFNPLIRMYKKIFVQLHEFEADARAVETHDVDEYCSLLARVALHSADYKLANHFSNSLTLKRIEMMRTLKHKIKYWKVAVVAAFIPVLFFVTACQDQVGNTEAVSSTSKYPDNVQEAIDRLVASNPDADFIVVPPTGPNPKDFEGEHAKHLSYINGDPIIESEAMLSVQVGKDEKGNAINYMIFIYNAGKNALPTEDQWKTAAQVWDESVKEEPVFQAVEQSAEFPNGLKGLQSFLKTNLRYPASSKRDGIEGTVYILFTVKKDGSLSDFELKQGVNSELDQEALRVMKLMPHWKAALQNGKPVNSRFVLPVIYKLKGEPTSSLGIQEVTVPFQVEYSKKLSGNDLIVSGTVTDNENNPLPGANVIVVGGTKGTSTDSEGKFTLTVPAQTKKLEVSFKGFNSSILKL